MKKSTKYVKKLLSLFLVVLMSIESFGAVVSDNDGSAFITKAEFDSLKNDFQSQIDQYNTSIDAKIDGAIAEYLNGMRLETTSSIVPYLVNYENKYGATFTTYDSTFSSYNIDEVGLLTSICDFGIGWDAGGIYNFHGIVNHRNDLMKPGFTGTEGTTILAQENKLKHNWNKCLPMKIVKIGGETYFGATDYKLKKEYSSLSLTTFSFQRQVWPDWLGTDLNKALDFSDFGEASTQVVDYLFWSGGERASGSKTVTFTSVDMNGVNTAANRTEKLCFAVSNAISNKEVVTRNVDGGNNFDSEVCSAISYGPSITYGGVTFGSGVRKAYDDGYHTPVIVSDWRPLFKWRRPKLYTVNSTDLINYDIYSSTNMIVKLYQGIPFSQVPKNTNSLRGKFYIKALDVNSTWWPTLATDCDVYISKLPFNNINPESESSDNIIWSKKDIAISTIETEIDFTINFVDPFATQTDLYIKIVPNQGFANVYAGDIEFVARISET